MIHADDVGLVSKSTESLAKMIAVIVNVFEAAGLTVLEKEDGNHAPAGIEPGISYHTARHRSPAG